VWQNLRNRENQLYDMLIFNSYIFESIAENEVLQYPLKKALGYKWLKQNPYLRNRLKTNVYDNN